MDDAEIALADSFINFEFAAYSPTSDNPPDPIINESGSSDPDPPVGNPTVEERIESSGLVEKEVNDNESGGVGDTIVAIDAAAAVGIESEGGEGRGMIAAVDNAGGMDSDGGDNRGDVIANDDEIRGRIMGVDDAVGMESEDGEIRGDVIVNGDEIRGEIMGVDDAVGVESEDGEIRGHVIANDDEIRGEIMGVGDAVGMESEDGEIRGDVIVNDDEIRGEIMGVGDAVGIESEDGEIRGDVIVKGGDEIRGEIMGVGDAVGMEREDGEIRGDVIANDDEIRGEIVVNDDEIRGQIVANDDEIRGQIVANEDVNATVTEGSNRENTCSSSRIKIHKEYELEEGEIVESDNDRKDGSDDEESEERLVRLTNELEILPRVPPVNVELGPHHILLPLGVVTSIAGAKVVVEGLENHDPLGQGSVLWITGRQTPLGVIDDTFAQVKNPHYIVRYNWEDEIPEGVHEGTLISFVAEFAKHVLNSNDLYKKGSDASGMYDEEVSKTEFSDDEQESEYNRLQKQAKRGQRSQNSDRMKNDRQHFPLNDGSIPKRLMVAHGHSPPIPSSGQGFSGVGRGHSSPLPPQQALVQHSPIPPNWSSGFPTNSVTYQENTQISHQQRMQGILFQQQFNPSHRFPAPTAYPGGQPNMYAEPIHAQGPVNQNQRTHFPQFQAPTYFQPVNLPGILGPPPHQFNPPTYFQPVNLSGILGAPPHQFNPPTYFHSPPIAGNQGGPPDQFRPPANFQSPPISGYQGGPPHQFNPPANFQSPPISGYQGGPPHQFNPPANFQSPPISANQNPPQLNHQFNPGAYDGRERTSGAYDGRGRERTFAGRRRRPSHRGGKGQRPAR